MGHLESTSGSPGAGFLRRVPLRRTFVALFMTALLAPFGLAVMAQDAPTALVATVDGPITPVTAGYLADGIRTAEEEGYKVFVVELDTPGGLDESMRDIVQAFFGAQVPVVVYVTPSGGRAASAGTFITMAAHFAAMAPGTTIGAATPVDLGGGEITDKIINDAAAFAESVAAFHGRDVQFAVDAVRDGRSITADQAAELGVVDLIARDLNVLLEEIDGQTVIMADGRQLIMDTAGGGVETYDPGFFRSLLLIIADPNLAFLFVSLGTLAVIYEVANPGLGLAGIIGVILLILGFFALSVLPITVAGAALLVLAAGLFIGELFVPGIGVLAAGGTLSLIVGGLLLFEDPFGIRPIVLWPVGLVMGGGVVLAGRLTWRARRAPAASGAEALVGRETVVATGGGRTGQAFVEGAWWRIRSRSEDLIEGRSVTVVATEGLELIVETKEDNP
jgi:membrane-bound serine protease (ClpP class)